MEQKSNLMILHQVMIQRMKLEKGKKKLRNLHERGSRKKNERKERRSDLRRNI